MRQVQGDYHPSSVRFAQLVAQRRRLVEHPITSAYDPAQKKEIRIGDAVRGGRYMGSPGTYHQDCRLHPKFPARKQASFAHLPGEAYCPEGRGESSEHREAKFAWVKFFEDQLSGCAVCTLNAPEVSLNHPCPATNLRGEVVPATPSYPGILWFCESCSQPHIYDLLRSADSAKSEWWTPGRTARIDIALLDKDERPTALIEIKRRHLSNRPFEYADKSGVPLFVLDVSLGENVQASLHDNQRQEKFLEMPDLSVSPPRRFDFVHYSIDGIILACGTDDEGRLNWRISYSDPLGGKYRAPEPSIGPFILASKSTVSCEEVNEDLICRAVVR